MWELVSRPHLSTNKKEKEKRKEKSCLTDGNALSTGEYPFETGQKKNTKKRNSNSFLHKNIYNMSTAPMG